MHKISYQRQFDTDSDTDFVPNAYRIHTDFNTETDTDTSVFRPKNTDTDTEFKIPYRFMINFDVPLKYNNFVILV